MWELDYKESWALKNNAQEYSALNIGCTFPIPLEFENVPQWYDELRSLSNWGDALDQLNDIVSAVFAPTLCSGHWYYKDFKDDTVESPKQVTGFSIIFRNSYGEIQYE